MKFGNLNFLLVLEVTMDSNQAASEN